MKNTHRLRGRALWPAATALLLGAAAAPAGDFSDDQARANLSGWQFGGDGHWREVDRIEGVWNAWVTITLCDSAGRPTQTPVPNVPAFDAMALFAANGIFHDTNAQNPALRSDGFGFWRRTGKRTYEFAFRLFRFDPALQAPIGPQIVRHEVQLAPDGRSYTSKGTAEWFDASNNPAPPFKTCSISTATRFR